MYLHTRSYFGCLCCADVQPCNSPLALVPVTLWYSNVWAWWQELARHLGVEVPGAGLLLNVSVDESAIQQSMSGAHGTQAA